MKTLSAFFLLLPLLMGAATGAKPERSAGVELVILGIAQDAGYPQALCYRPHCIAAWEDKQRRKMATSLGVVDHLNQSQYLFEATPDLPEQLYLLQQRWSAPEYQLGGVFLTHAHMGHYTGLMYFGREVASTKALPVYAMPVMSRFLTQNGPWSQLVTLKNISLQPLADGKAVTVGNIRVTPLRVPHRDEFSETVGYFIQGPDKTALFIPDIDKWDKWGTDIAALIPEVDYALLDATFYSADELPGRAMAEVPHPLVLESMAKFEHLPASQRDKIIFIHFNHTNPLLNGASEEYRRVTGAGFHVAQEGQRLSL
ncbi:MBL fold metallo-hydrolase [Shewanella sp. GXUN23E]|uniref:MBL fold metallo-hydrolase n=1 Tax=Shewanella sp. GXUN23E TaxID=3422498 RepID=UPI003D7D7302